MAGLSAHRRIAIRIQALPSEGLGASTGGPVGAGTAALSLLAGTYG